MAAVFASIFSENVAGSSPGRKTRPEPERAGEPDEEGFKPILENSAGIDIGASEHYVAVPNAGRGPKVKSFRAETYDLRNMAAFLEESGAKTVVMEATGVYWYAPFAFLKKMGFDVRLLNPRYVTNVLGKTDVRDCQWLKKLASCGLAPECFVPPRQFFELRAMVRLRIGLVRQQSAAVNRIIKCLRMANINLEHAVADVKGKTGLRIIDAIIAGEKEPLALAGMRDKRCRKKKEEEIARCLDGVYSAYTVIELKCHRSILGTIQEQIEELDENILVHLEAFKPGPSGPGGGDSAPCAPRARKPADKAIDLAGPEIVRILGNGVDLTAIPGISSRISLAIVSEIGTDISKWRSAKHFSSWLGLCPGSKISGGKVISATTRKVNSPAAQALMMAAKAVGRSDNAFGEFYRKKKCSRGPQKALTATAHLIARTVYGMIRHGSAYTAKIAEERERRAAARKDARLSREIAARGDGWFAAEAARRGYAPVPEAA
jgi:transposase